MTIPVVATTGKAAQGQIRARQRSETPGLVQRLFRRSPTLLRPHRAAGGFSGAMEIPPPITFFESWLLFDPATNPDSARFGIFGTIRRWRINGSAISSPAHRDEIAEPLMRHLVGRVMHEDAAPRARRRLRAAANSSPALEDR